MTTFGIDPGHNSPYDGGAVGIKSENSLILEVTRRVIPKLKTLGHVVIDCSPQQTVTSLRSSLRQRTNRANKFDVDVFVSVHFNAFNRRAHGTEVLYISAAGKRLAAPVVKEISKLGFTNRGLKYRDNLHVLRATNAPAILIECCFCDSARDMRLFDAEKMANAIVRGLTGQDPSSPRPCPTCGRL